MTERAAHSLVLLGIAGLLLAAGHMLAMRWADWEALPHRVQRRALRQERYRPHTAALAAVFMALGLVLWP
ncbi:hypothetical protein J4573_42370 [Actinomadura barringtoniae]|uniref:Uncharacterized protein n=1 Tax=Actinomadura barringtoniae TaxID=1427535 RepID=A0A939PS71_9ACTN|nr:hypothetical protein [Actinomadura barringtoniae]MBO2453796.1 hypothetical protein [Actinomadura barringtoniae]